MSTRHALLKLLADGAFHSGPVLGERLGVSRAAVNKAIQVLVESGADIHRVSGRGYRLGEPFVPLSEALIRALLAEHALPADNVQGRTRVPHMDVPMPRAQDAQARPAGAGSAGAAIEVFDEVDSTNQQLLRTPDLSSGRVCLAEAQSAGRGRRGRGWVATPCHNILLSMSWRFETGPAGLAGLSLAAGVAVLRALDDFGVHDAGLKWPNDILRDGRKLAGLLIDLRGEASGPSLVILGLGLNVHLAPNEAAHIDQPWAALREILPAPVDRNRLAGLLILHLGKMFRTFEHAGFEAFRAEWEGHHLYAGQPVRLHTGHEDVLGTVAGIDAQGGLRVHVAGGELRTFHSGDVSLRAAHETL
jgi:BirA family transcriptional regulator, biotin operon repressor / biotin---[acetyl-CoA-carboxylase] ligase